MACSALAWILTWEQVAQDVNRFLPIVRLLGIGPIQFSLIMILNLAIGCLTPPMATVMFVANSITGTKTGEFIRESLPLLAALLLALGLVTFVPAVTTWLPNL